MVVLGPHLTMLRGPYVAGSELGLTICEANIGPCTLSCHPILYRQLCLLLLFLWKTLLIAEFEDGGPALVSQAAHSGNIEIKEGVTDTLTCQMHPVFVFQKTGLSQETELEVQMRTGSVGQSAVGTIHPSLCRRGRAGGARTSSSWAWDFSEGTSPWWLSPNHRLTGCLRWMRPHRPSLACTGFTAHTEVASQGTQYSNAKVPPISSVGVTTRLQLAPPLSQDRLLIKENIHPDYFSSWHFYSFHFASQENSSEKAKGT